MGFFEKSKRKMEQVKIIKQSMSNISAVIEAIPFKVNGKEKEKLSFDKKGFTALTNYIICCMQQDSVEDTCSVSVIPIELKDDTILPMILFINSDGNTLERTNPPDKACYEFVNKVYDWLSEQYENRGITKEEFNFIVNNHSQFIENTIMDEDTQSVALERLTLSMKDIDSTIKCINNIKNAAKEIKNPFANTQPSNINQIQLYNTKEPEEENNNDIIISTKEGSDIYKADKDTIVTFSDRASTMLKDEFVNKLLGYPYEYSTAGLTCIAEAIEDFLKIPYQEFESCLTIRFDDYNVEEVLSSKDSIFVYIIDNNYQILEAVAIYAYNMGEDGTCDEWRVNKYTDAVARSDKLTKLLVDRANLKNKPNNEYLVFALPDTTVSISIGKVIDIFYKHCNDIINVDKIYFGVSLLNTALRKFIRDFNSSRLLFGKENNPIASIDDYEALGTSRTSVMIDVFETLYDDNTLNLEDIDWIHKVNDGYLSYEGILNEDFYKKESDERYDYRIHFKDKVVDISTSEDKGRYVFKLNYLFKNEFPYMIWKGKKNIISINHVNSESLYGLVKSVNGVLDYLKYKHSEKE